MAKSFAEFTEIHTSCLQEIANMGAGNAATSLSDMIGAPTDISVPTVKILPSAEANKLADMLSSRTMAYLVTLSVDLKGSLLFIVPFEFAERMAQTYFPDASVKCADDVDEMTASVMQEAVNIVAAAYANNFAILSGMTVDISVPERVTSPSAKIYAQNDPGTVNSCFINTSVEIVDCKRSFNVIFFPEAETISGFMARLGVC